MNTRNLFHFRDFVPKSEGDPGTGGRKLLPGVISPDKSLINAIKLIRIGVKAIVMKLTFHVEVDQQGTGNAQRKPQDIDAEKDFFTSDLSEEEFERMIHSNRIFL